MGLVSSTLSLVKYITLLHLNLVAFAPPSLYPPSLCQNEVVAGTGICNWWFEAPFYLQTVPGQAPARRSPLKLAGTWEEVKDTPVVHFGGFGSREGVVCQRNMEQ